MISFHIVSYNTPQHAKNAVRSIVQYTNFPYEILVLKNGEATIAQGFEQWTKQTYPTQKITVFPRADNLGFARGHNFLATQASKEAGFFCLLNSDMFFAVGAVDAMRKVVLQGSDIGLVCPTQVCGCDLPLYAPLMASAKDVERFSAGRDLQVACLATIRHATLPFLVRREVWDKLSTFDTWDVAPLRENLIVGAFDEGIDPSTVNGWHVDWDLFNRLHLAGYLCLQLVNFFAYHYHHVSVSKFEDAHPTFTTTARNNYVAKYGAIDVDLATFKLGRVRPPGYPQK